MKEQRAGEGAFTLIELLIVVAIISVLAAIAVPNFLEAQVRAKVSRVKNDQRTIATGVEMYRIDHNAVPARRDMTGIWPYPPANEKGKYMKGMTTPIAYLTQMPEDIFNTVMKGSPVDNDISCSWMDYWDEYQTYNWIKIQRAEVTDFDSGNNYAIVSVGPDGFMGVVPAYEQPSRWKYPVEPQSVRQSAKMFYDPTNGTVSNGNIYRWRKDLQQGELYPRINLP